MFIGEKLKELAKKLNKEHQDVAHDLGVSKSQFSHYVNNRRKVPSDLLKKIIDTYNVNPEFLFTDEADLFLINEDYIKENLEKYYYVPTSIPAGDINFVNPITKKEMKALYIPPELLGKWAYEDVYITQINGESMNRIIPDQSFIVVKPIPIFNLKNDDIIIYSFQHDYSVKRFFNDEKNERFIFKPDSTNDSFADKVIPYDLADELEIHGKVVFYMVELE